MRFPKLLRLSVRRSGAKFEPDVGNRQHYYNYGYPQFCYHLKWNGPTVSAARYISFAL